MLGAGPNIPGALSKCEQSLTAMLGSLAAMIEICKSLSEVLRRFESYLQLIS